MFILLLSRNIKNNSQIILKTTEFTVFPIVSYNVLCLFRFILVPFTLHESDTRRPLFVYQTNKEAHYSNTFIVQ